MAATAESSESGQKTPASGPAAIVDLISETDPPSFTCRGLVSFTTLPPLAVWIGLAAASVYKEAWWVPVEITAIQQLMPLW